MPKCEFGCNKEATHQFKSSKKWCCSSNVNSCEGKRKRDSEKKRGKNPFRGKEHPRGMLGKKHPMKGKTYDEIFGTSKAKEILRKMSESAKGKSSWSKLSEEQKKKMREKLRETILERYKKGWMPKAGRCKKYRYSSPVAGNINLDGTWELEVAKWLDKNGLIWKRNTERFPYINLKGDLSYYTPDFWVNDWNSFLEVKGYETELDRCKWSQFKYNLKIWKKEDILKIMESGQDGNAADC